MTHEKLERIRRMKAAGEKVAVLTAYDYPTARLLDEGGVDVLLVGDSVGMVVLDSLSLFFPPFCDFC